MKAICVLGLMVCAACGGASASTQTPKSEVANTSAQSDNAGKVSDKPAPVPAKDGGGW